jgi:hypothetical protein
MAILWLKLLMEQTASVKIKHSFMSLHKQGA